MTQKDWGMCCGGGCGCHDDGKDPKVMVGGKEWCCQDACDCVWDEKNETCSCGGTCACHECDDDDCCGGGCGCHDGDGVMISEEDFVALQVILGRFEEDEEPSEEAMLEVEEILKKYKS